MRALWERQGAYKELCSLYLNREEKDKGVRAPLDTHSHELAKSHFVSAHGAER